MLISYAKKCGVKFYFETAVDSAIITDKRITGISINRSTYDCDMLIDASGVHSVIRQGLPEEFNIEKIPFDAINFFMIAV